MGNKDRETREWRERAGIISLINATHRLDSGLLPPFFVLISPILIRFLQSAQRYSEDWRCLIGCCPRPVRVKLDRCKIWNKNPVPKYPLPGVTQSLEGFFFLILSEPKIMFWAKLVFIIANFYWFSRECRTIYRLRVCIGKPKSNITLNITI